MIDVHSHIVFGVDDGAKTIDQSIQIIKEAEKAGFTKIIATPHYMDHYYECDKNEIAERISTIKEKLAESRCGVEIIQGNEIYFTRHINEFLEDGKASALNNEKYVLFELPLNAEVMNLDQVVYQILEKGRIPILAHPERYPFVQKNPNKLLPLLEVGVLMQCNYGSIIGQYKKDAQKTVKKMLEHNMVHLLGSDVHRPETIYSCIDNSLYEIEKIIGKEKLDELTTVNPEKIINGEQIDVDDPIPVKTSVFKKFINKI